MVLKPKWPLANLHVNPLATFVNNENRLKMSFGPSLYNYQSFNVCDLDMMLINYLFLLVYHPQNTLSLNFIIGSYHSIPIMKIVVLGK